ncbi:hypothetical protein HPB51_027297 [Rhipicephalus microplus]|uniref:C2H2-type domain-containing protein n=1 Tax=Rhipicephalus microplus TaxID=6941 RepID=A0A9J6D0S8_RHIMP|nr:hypothetical protein HPB51_027297 [Rhipicephalus microplus]
MNASSTHCTYQLNIVKPASASNDVGSSHEQTESESEDVRGGPVPLQVCLEVGEKRLILEVCEWSLFKWCSLTGPYNRLRLPTVDKNNNGSGSGGSRDDDTTKGQPVLSAAGIKHGRRTPLQCPLCPYTTHNATTMREHLPVHTGERPFCCPMCNKRFSRKKYFRVHLRLHDKASGHVPVNALHCGALMAVLEAYVPTEEGERGNVCPECNKSYKYAGNLRTHMRVHTGERPYMCDVCGLRFTCSSYLQGRSSS